MKKVKSDMNACEDFFNLTVIGHIIACAMETLGMASVDAMPTSNVIQYPDEVWQKDNSERKAILLEVASQIVDQNVDLSCTFADSQSREPTSAPADGVYAYACETLTLGLVLLEFKDVIREGDGDRVLKV